MDHDADGHRVLWQRLRLYHWSLVSSLAPMRLIGLTGGVFNFVGGLGGITVPLVIGYLAQSYGFAPALVYISVVALIGALSYILLVGDVKRVG